MAAPFFIGKNRLSEMALLRVGSRTVIDEFERLRDGLTRAAGRESASLFAEPVVRAGEGSDEVSWYTALAGDVAPLAALDEEARGQAERLLRERLAALAPLLRDPDLGPLIARALYVTGPDDILVVGRQPVLVNWGALPLDVPRDEPDAVERHFRATLGAHIPVPPPPIRGTPVRPESPDPGPGAREGSAGETRRLMIAVATAAALLLLLAVPGVLATAPANPVSAADEAALLRQQEEINRALTEKIALTRKAIEGATCQRDGSLITPKDVPPPPPPPPQRARVQRKSGPITKETLNDLVDSSVVFIIVKKENGGASGTGFFVNERTIVTNRHVIEGAVEVRVTNRFLGRLTPVQVTAMTETATPGTPDFAVLSIAVDRAPPPVPVSNAASRLLDVLAAGYPGRVTAEDAEAARLKQGDASAVPPSTITQGVINHVYGAEGALPTFLHSAAIAPGNSGGPLLDSCGRAIGVNTYTGVSDALVEDDENPGKMKKVPVYGFGAYFSLGAKGLRSFLDAHGVTYQGDDAPCRPEVVAEAAPPTPPAAPGPTPSPSPAPPAGRGP